VSAGRRTTSKRQERSCGLRRLSQGIYLIGREPVIMKDTDESPRALVPVGGRGYVGDGDQGTFRIIVGEPPAKLPITWRPRKSANTTQRRQLLSQSRTPRRWHYVVNQDRDRELPAIFPRPSFLWPTYRAVDSAHNTPHLLISMPKPLVGRDSLRVSVR
jgi:hypothetical protein